MRSFSSRKIRAGYCLQSCQVLLILLLLLLHMLVAAGKNVCWVLTQMRELQRCIVLVATRLHSFYPLQSGQMVLHSLPLQRVAQFVSGDFWMELCFAKPMSLSSIFTSLSLPVLLYSNIKHLNDISEAVLEHHTKLPEIFLLLRNHGGWQWGVQMARFDSGPCKMGMLIQTTSWQACTWWNLRSFHHLTELQFLPLHYIHHKPKDLSLCQRMNNWQVTISSTNSLCLKDTDKFYKKLLHDDSMVMGSLKGDLFHKPSWCFSFRISIKD